MTDATPEPVRQTRRLSPQFAFSRNMSKIFRSRIRGLRLSLQNREINPQINISVNVAAKNLSENDYEVTLTLDAKAGESEQPRVPDRAAVCRRHPRRRDEAGPRSAVPADRGAAPAVPVRSADHRRSGAQRRLPAADDRPDRLRGALPPQHGAGAAAEREHRHQLSRTAEPRGMPAPTLQRAARGVTRPRRAVHPRSGPPTWPRWIRRTSP